MKNKRLAKVFAMLLIIIVGIGGACFAKKSECTQGIHNFDVNGKNAYVCKDCGAFCDEKTGDFGDWVYKDENNLTDQTNHFRQCLNANHDHGGSYKYIEPHTDKNKDGKCDTCKYPCVNNKHNFDIEGNNAYTCKDCGYFCTEEGEYTYKYYVNGNLVTSEKKCIMFCANPNHNHGETTKYIWSNKTHYDENKDGKCDFCEYPCMKKSNYDASIIHNFDIEGGNPYTCKDCGLFCKGYKFSFQHANFSSSDTLSYLDWDYIEYCSPCDHSQGHVENIVRPARYRHIDENGDGVCDNCSYPCLFGTHNFVNGICTKCAYNSRAIEAYKDDYGSLIIKYKSSNLKGLSLEFIESVVIVIDDKILIEKENLMDISIDSDNIKKIECGKDSLWIADGYIMYIARPEGECASILGTAEHKVRVFVRQNVPFSDLRFRSSSIIKGCFEDTQTPNKEETKTETNKTEPSKTGFTDVENGRWSEKQIQFVSEQGIMNGIGDGLFNPTGTVTREQLAVILSRIDKKGKLDIISSTKSYSDESKAGSNEAKTAIKNYGVHVVEGAYYKHTSEVTRKEVAVALTRALDLSKKITLSENTKNQVEKIKETEKITDEEIINAIGVMVELKIMQGDNNGAFNLEGLVTREQLAKIIYELYNKDFDSLAEKCASCKGYIINEWEYDETEHWKVCSPEKGKLSHVSSKYKGKHTYDDSGKCTVCDYEKNKEDDKKEETKTEESKTGFTDVKANDWSAEAIKFVVDKKIMNGMGDGTFNPLGNVTKAQLATIIKRVADDKKIEIEEATGSMAVRYSDEYQLPSWAKDAILLVGPYIPEESGYVTMSPRQFGSNGEIKRKQVALALVKALRLEESVTVSEATKKKIAEIKKNENITDENLIKAAEILYETGIMQGDGKNLNLENKISRQEMAKTIQNLYNANLETREKCTKKGCTGYINPEWTTDNNSHWKQCSKNSEHKYKEVKHEFDLKGICKICTTPEKCTKSNCTGLAGEWKTDSTYHWKICSKNKNHELRKNAHTYDKGSNVCNICEYTNDKEMCSNVGCKGEMEWIENDTMHVLVCKKNKAHVSLIEGHRLDANNKCTVCGKVDKRKYESKFVDFQNTNHWAWRNVCYMAEKGIVKGVHNELNDTYILYPEDTITAEALVALLARVLEYKPEDKDKISNDSVYIPMENPDSYWSIGEWKYLMNYLKNKGKDPKKEIQKFLSNNANSGSDEEITENYRKEISRERVAFLLGSFLESNVKQHSLVDSFEDWGSVKSAYKDYFERLSSYDVIRGIEDNGKIYASPNTKVTRVQAIALIDRLNSVLTLDYKY